VSPPERGGTAELRVAAWHAEALRRWADADAPGALAAARAGLRVVRDQSDALGTVELRAHAVGHGAELAALGLRITVGHGSAAAVLAWSEEFRAHSLERPAARPPNDVALAADLYRLRQANVALTDAVAAGRDPRPSVTACAALERAVRDRARRANHARQDRPHDPHDQRQLVETLGRRALVSYLINGADLHAVSLVDGRARRHDLGPGDVVGRALDQLRFAAARLARSGRDAASVAAARAALAHSAKQLGDLVCAPLAEIADRDLVVVPTGDLHLLPWSLLPALRARPVVVAPSARLWLRASGPPRRSDRGSVLLVAGPRLRHARAEIIALARAYPQAVVLSRKPPQLGRQPSPGSTERSSRIWPATAASGPTIRCSPSWNSPTAR